MMQIALFCGVSLKTVGLILKGMWSKLTIKKKNQAVWQNKERIYYPSMQPRLYTKLSKGVPQQRCKLA